MEKLAEIAFVRDEHQAAMVQALLEGHGIPTMQQQVGPSGPQVGYGLLSPGGGQRRVMVHSHRFEEARALLVDAEILGDEIPDPANQEHLERAEGRRKPRNYGVLGAYARAYLVALVVFALVFAAWLLSRAL